MTQRVLSVTPLSVPNYGEVKLLTTAPDQVNPCYGVYLDKPSAASTTPATGNNSFSDHSILFSLPSKSGGRFTLWVTNSRAGATTFDCGGLTQQQFFGLQSVQQAELILKSISY